MRSEEERVSSNVKEKTSKISFLQKIISLTETSIKTSIDASPNRIISGLDSDKTCHFLQLLTIAAINFSTSSNQKESTKKQVSEPSSRQMVEINEFNDNDSVSSKCTQKNQNVIIEHISPRVEYQFKKPSCIRPKTARRGPPKVKLKKNSALGPPIEKTIKISTVIIKDDDGGDAVKSLLSTDVKRIQESHGGMHEMIENNNE